MNKSSEQIKKCKLLTQYYWQNNEANKGSHAHQQRAAHCMNPQTFQAEKIGITLTVNIFLIISFCNTKIAVDRLNPIIQFWCTKLYDNKV